MYYIKSCTACVEMNHKENFKLSQDHSKETPRYHNAKFYNYLTGLALRGYCNKSFTVIQIGMYMNLYKHTFILFIDKHTYDTFIVGMIPVAEVFLRKYEHLMKRR